ncbi:MAG: GLPGLI family protein [Bacteroidota bacterium]
MRTLTYVFIVMAALGVFQNIFGQEFQGMAVYQTKSNFEIDLDRRQISEQQKARIRERMKTATEKTYQLKFNRTQSLYEEEERLEAPSTDQGGRGIRFAFIGGAGGSYYKDIQKKEYLNQSEMFGKNFLIRDSLPQWEWQMGSETKKIGTYTCYKATAIRKRDSTMNNRFRQIFRRGRDNQDEQKKDSVAKDSTTENTTLLSRLEAPAERVITVWYTLDIPISQGPGPYWGLPGLILEVNDGRTAILCNKIVLNPEETIEIKVPSKGKEVSQGEYDAIMAEKMEEMSQRFRAGNRRGASGIRISN